MKGESGGRAASMTRRRDHRPHEGFLASCWRQQRVEKTLAIVEARRLEPHEGGGKIDKALARRQVEQAQRARDGETSSPGSCDAILIIHQQEISFGR